MGDFDGFPGQGLEFLTELGQQDKAWFQDHRATYDEAVATPAKAFVEAMGDLLRADVSSDLEAQPKVNGSISPINNDVRFNPDATPYKDHLLFRWWEGPTKKAAPTLFVRLSEDSVGFATGAALPDLDRWRAAIDDRTTGSALADAISRLGRGRDLEVAGAELKRVPKPYDPDHPRGDLLRHKAFQARWPEPTPKSVTSGAFADWCARRLNSCGDIHHWLVDNLS